MTEFKAKQYRIMVVDDSKMIQSAIEQLANKMGSTVLHYLNPLDALIDLPKVLPDFLVVDYEMPDLTGVDFIKKVRADSSYDTMPILMLTAIDSENLAMNAVEAGADDFIEKSFLLKLFYPKIYALARIRQKNLDMLSIQRMADFQAMLATFQHEMGNSVAKLSGYSFKMLKDEDEVRKITYDRIQEEVSALKDKLRSLENLHDLSLSDYPGGSKIFKKSFKE